MKGNILTLLWLLLFAAGMARGQPAPTITQQPASQTNYAGGNATFSVGVSGAGPFTYQWQLNGTNLPNGIINTAAGGGIINPSNGPNGILANDAEFYSVADVAVDTNGNFFFVDTGGNRIYKVASGGAVSAVAGNGVRGFSGDGGAAVNAELCSPHAVAVDATGNLFIADTYNERVRKVGTNGVITTVAGNGTAAYGGDGGAATSASLYQPSGVAVDAYGNLFIADTDNNRIRKVGTNGIVTTVAGNGTNAFAGDGGPATNAYLSNPGALALDAAGNLYIADGGSRIREVGTNGIIFTVAGGGNSGWGGAATNADLMDIGGVAVDTGGNLFISSSYTVPFGYPGYSAIRPCLILQVWTNGIITCVAGMGLSIIYYYYDHPPYGDGGLATNAILDYPGGVSVDASGGLFIADSGHGRVRKVVMGGPVLSLSDVTTNNAGVYDVVVTGPGGSVTSSNAFLTVWAPATITAQPQNQFIPVGSNAVLNVATAGTPPLDYQWYFDGAALTGETNSALEITVISSTNAGSYKVVVTNLYGAATSSVANISVGCPPQITVQPQSQAAVTGGGAVLTVSASGDCPLSYQWQWNGSNLPARTITTFAGGGSLQGDGGPATNAILGNFLGGPTSIATDANGNLFIADYFNERIRKVGTNGIITTVAGNGSLGETGNGGPATQAELYRPATVAADAAGNFFIAEADTNHIIRHVGTNGIITGLITNGSSLVGRLAVDANDNLFICFQNYEAEFSGAFFYEPQVIELAWNGMVTTVAGDPNDTNNYVEFDSPSGLALDASGNLFIADSGENCVWKVDANGIITIFADYGIAGFSGDGGPVTSAKLNSPEGLAVDAGGNLFIADYGNNRIREVDTNGIITTVAGNGTISFSGDGGPATNAALCYPTAVAVDPFGNLFINDSGNHRIRLAAQGPACALTNLSLANDGSYDVVVTSPYGTVTSSVVTMTVFSPPQNLGATMSAAQGVQLQWNGTPGYHYVLLMATNLTPPINWQPLVTNVADSNGNWSFTDTNTANSAQFYSAMAPLSP